MVTIRKIAVSLLLGTSLIAGSHSAAALAAETPLAGIDMILSKYYLNPLTADLVLSSFALTDDKKEENSLAFAQVDNYVNIRKEPGEDSKILGKLYKACAAVILEKADKWYRVKSGSVTGYIKGEFLLTGEEAEKFSETTGEKIAEVATATLRVRQKASKDSLIVTLIPLGDEYKIISEKGDWVKIQVDSNTEGYVLKDFITIKKVYEEAVSIEEEKKEQEQTVELMSVSASVKSTQRSFASKNSASSDKAASKSLAVSKQSSPESSSSSASIGAQLVEYALRFEGNPYVWGGTSLTNGADCSGFTQSVFKKFGIYIPRTSTEQAAAGSRVSLENIKPGDLIFYRKNGSINHVALYIGNGKVIAAKSTREGIRITSLYYRTPYKAVRYTY